MEITLTTTSLDLYAEAYALKKEGKKILAKTTMADALPVSHFNELGIRLAKWNGISDYFVDWEEVKDIIAA